MNAFAEAILDKATETRTENGAVTYSTSLDPVVDMFFTIAAKRGFNYNEIKQVISPAFAVEPELALRVAFWLRDIKQGAGERQIYRYILRFLLENNYTHLAERAISATIDLGRVDDLFTLLEYSNDTTARLVLDRISHELLERRNGLVAKWIPRSGKINSRIRNYLRLSRGEFRHLLVELTKVVESQMCKKEWDKIIYSHVPSLAMKRYNKTFKRNDTARFDEYLNRVRAGAVNPETGKVEKINTGTLYPYDVTTGNIEETTRDLMWRDLPDFVGEGLSFIPVIDTSGSMTSQIGSSKLRCMDVAVSLGIYLAERNKSAFKDLWINFSTNPKFNVLRGATITEKIRNLDYRNWCGSTNLEAAMKLIVDTAVKNDVPVEDMPNYLLILSDMEFNSWGNAAPGKQVRNLFEDAGYKMPNIVWWNIQSRNNSTPVRANENGMALVSGFSPTIVQNLLRGEITPYKIMLNTIMKDRYSY